MYIRTLKIQNLKLLKDFPLEFTRPDGSLRMWTALIGMNGTAKTSILQAIALAAAGRRHVNTLARPIARHLRDRRASEDVEVRIEATFSFSDIAHRNEGLFPGLPTPYPPNLHLRSKVTLPPGSSLLEANSAYENTVTAPADGIDPLDLARDQHKNHWFVAGYGVARHLPDASTRPTLDFPEVDRLMPLFQPQAALTSTAFANYFGAEGVEDVEDAEDASVNKANMYSRMLKAALFNVEELLPHLDDLELRGRGGVRNAGDLQERARFVQRFGTKDHKIPAVALSHGYQSTIAWIADLVGHVVLEAQMELEPADMCGLVLVDELDLYLHPTWQVVLVSALRKTFPRMQFVVTTHSPLVLAALDPEKDQVVRLEQDPETGDIFRAEVDEDPRMLTETELLRLYFGLGDIHPGEVGRLLREYRYLASNPYRTDADDRKLSEWRAHLAQEGVDPHFEPVARKTFVRRTG